MTKKTFYKLGSSKGDKDTLEDLKKSGMPLRTTLASGKAPSSSTGKKKKSK